jgi:hypothetical protein
MTLHDIAFCLVGSRMPGTCPEKIREAELRALEHCGVRGTFDASGAFAPMNPWDQKAYEIFAAGLPDIWPHGKIEYEIADAITLIVRVTKIRNHL